MPKASIDKYGEALQGEHKIGSPKDLPVPAPTGYFSLSKQVNECKFCGRIL
jgi:hypothetical protein